MNPEQTKKFIIAARQKGVNDEEIVSYLKNKGVDFNKVIESNKPIEKRMESGNYGDQVGAEMISGVKSAVDHAKQGAEEFNKGIDESGKGNILNATGHYLKGIVKSGAGAIEGVAETVFAPVSPALKHITEALTPAIRATNPKLAAIYDAAMPKIQELIKNNPETADIAGHILNTALIAVGGGASEATIKKGVTESLTKDAITTIPGELKNLAIDSSKVIKNKVVGPALTKDEVAGKILQGKTENIGNLDTALKDIDVKGIKTQEQFSGALDAKIRNKSNELDIKLGENKNLYTIDNLEIPVKVGESTVKHNFVKDSIAQLKDHYSSINDVASLEKISQLEKKAASEGLSVKEINNLAKEQGSAIDSFKRNGDLASSNKAQAAENTRTGLKNTGRQLYNDPVYAEIDNELANTMKVKKLVDKQVEAVNALKQKSIDLKWTQKTATKIGKVLDVVTGGSLKGMLKGIGMRVDEGAISNALQIEKNLNKNLVQFEKLSKAKTEAEVNVILNSDGMKALLKDAKVETGTESINKATNILKAGETKSLPMKEVKVNGGPTGATVNIGLNTNVGGTITHEEIKKILKDNFNIDIKKSVVKQSGTEPTLIAKLSRPLTDAEQHMLTKLTKQDAIPQLYNGVGKMTDIGKESWGDFNPEYFMGFDGKTLSSKIKK